MPTRNRENPKNKIKKSVTVVKKYRLFIWMTILALLAGLINAISVFGYDGTTVSHVTGLISKFSISVSTGDIKGCLDIFLVILAFFAGAVTAGIITGERAFHLHTVYGFIIIAVGVLVLLPIVLAPAYSVVLLAFLMGLQNGMVVSFNGVLVRTTHMTGNLTDFGVYIGYWIRGKKEKPIYGMVPAVTLLGFFAGGVIGILLYKLIGNYVFVVTSAVYILLGLIYFRLQKSCEDKEEAT